MDPKLIEAAGGYVVRKVDGRTDLLLIFRRGVWDLPKGKLDSGETPAACALREVSEETGADDLAILRGAGSTAHTYTEGGQPIVKTTWWFIMSTLSDTFTPEIAEQIEKVEWIPWPQARELIGYDNLREHMSGLDNVISELSVEVA